jgi:hypothetical protein
MYVIGNVTSQVLLYMHASSVYKSQHCCCYLKNTLLLEKICCSWIHRQMPKVSQSIDEFNTRLHRSLFDKTYNKTSENHLSNKASCSSIQDSLWVLWPLLVPRPVSHPLSWKQRLFLYKRLGYKSCFKLFWYVSLSSHWLS